MSDDPIRRHWTNPDAQPWEALTAEPAGVGHREVDADGTPALWLEPANPTADSVIFYIHGGGFVSGSIWTHRKLVGHLAAAAGRRALLVSYELSPGHRHPYQLDQVTRAYEWARAQAAPAKIAVAGDSCGAWLAVSLTHRVAHKPAALGLISPWVDMTQSGATYRTNAEKDPFFQKPVVDGLAATFLGSTDPRDPAVDLLQQDLTGFPPMIVQVGADETLLDDSRALHAMAVSAGVESRLEVYPDQLHTFQMAAGRTTTADDAIRSLAHRLTS